jgi:cytochrome c553
MNTWTCPLALSLALSAVALGACGKSEPPPPKTESPGFEAVQESELPPELSESGRRIYFEALDATGNAITATGIQTKPDGSPIMACADCHGPDGRGRTMETPAGTVRTPNITFARLAEATPDRPAYDESTLGVAVRTGEAHGRSLGTMMPRWQLSDTDLRDLVAFLKTLSADTKR